MNDNSNYGPALEAGDLLPKLRRRACAHFLWSAIPRQAVACAAAICACTLPILAYELPPEHLSSTNFPAWRDSAHMLIVTKPTPGGVEVTLLVEKPSRSDVYWSVYLNLYEGTNMVAQWLKLGDDVLDRERLALTGAKVMGVKAVQSFTLSVSSNCLPQSTLTFSQCLRHPRLWDSGTVTAPTIVSLRDVCNGATSGFRKGKPIYPPAH